MCPPIKSSDPPPPLLIKNDTSLRKVYLVSCWYKCYILHRNVELRLNHHQGQHSRQQQTRCELQQGSIPGFFAPPTTTKEPWKAQPPNAVALFPSQQDSSDKAGCLWRLSKAHSNPSNQRPCACLICTHFDNSPTVHHLLCYSIFLRNDLFKILKHVYVFSNKMARARA